MTARCAATFRSPSDADGPRLQLQLPDAIWLKLNWAWSAFFAVMGALNIWIAYHFDTDTWVNFKLFGGMGLMVVFVIAQAIYMSRYLPQEGAEKKDQQP